MPYRQSEKLRLAAARADFLEGETGGAAGVPDIVSASWVRSISAGVDSERPAADFAEVDLGSRLVRCAEPVIEQLRSESTDMPLTIALTDKNARIVSRIDLSPAVGRLLDRVDLSPGFNYAESAMGTNGVGTVIEAGCAVSIIGPAHFSESLHMFACTGAPILDPVSGRVEGILDLSTITEAWSPLMHSLVKSAAKDISRNLLLERSQAQVALFETYLLMDSRSTREAVFAFGDTISMANSTAHALFSPTEQMAIQQHATFIMGRKDRASETVQLPGSERLVQMRGTRLVAGGETAGIVVLARPVESVQGSHAKSASMIGEQILPSAAVANEATGLLLDNVRKPHQTIASGTSPAWVRACMEIDDALAGEDPTIVVGETGSGKFTLIAEFFHARWPGGRSICIDANQLHTDLGMDFDEVLEKTVSQTLCIVRNIDQLHTEGVTQLDQLFTAIAASSAPVAFAATLSDSSLESDLPFHTLLSHFEVSVQVPPLRCRTDDLPRIIGRTLEELAPQRKSRISPDAERLLAGYSWPRNVTQLREALAYALRRRPVGEIQPQDLPPYCHTAPRKRLTPLEEAERDAIVAAIKTHDGNRQAAAAHVGMSRSSLYRKLKAYGIKG